MYFDILVMVSDMMNYLLGNAALPTVSLISSGMVGLDTPVVIYCI